MDIADGLNRLSGNESLYRDILREFRLSLDETAADMERYLARNEREEASRLAHAIKGQAGNVGAKELFAAAAALEQDIAAGHHYASLQNFLAALRTVQGSLASIGTKEHEANKPDSADLSQLTALAQKLAREAEHSSFDAVTTFEELNKTAGVSFKKELTDIGNHLKIFDFEKAGQSIARLIHAIKKETAR
jgi:HPt (histidine-containing phosphotransfer) domain-containing protein